MEDALERPDAEIAARWIEVTAKLPGRDAEDDAEFAKAIAERDSEEELHWAQEALMDLQFRDPLRLLEIVFLIARSTADEWVLCILGAGPLEGLLAGDPTLIDPVALEVPASPGLARALGHVWRHGMPEQTWAMVQRLASRPEA